MPPAHPRSRIIVVDDDLGSRTLAAIVLAEAGHSPVCVPSVKRALERIEQEEPDLVLTDLLMPESGGLDLIRALSGHAHPPPVLVMTSSDDEALIAQALDLGAAGVLRKPIPIERLATTVAGVLDAHARAAA